MKATIYKKYGPPEVLQIADVPKPELTDDEVRIKVYATTVNRTDTGLRSAAYFVSRFITGLFRPKMQITGTEFAGKIEAVGKNVVDYKVGDMVFGFNDTRGGAHAEYKTEASNGPLAKIPKGFNFYDVVACGEGATYAINIIRAAGIDQNKRVLVYGASGAIGSAAVQICKYFGAEVVAVCGTKNVKLLNSLGADKVINYQKENFTEVSGGFDCVIDAVGKSSYGECKKLLRQNGIYVSSELGDWCQNIFLAMWFALTRQRKVIFPIPKINKEIMEYIRQMLEAGKFKPVIDRTYQLEEIIEASRYVETGQKTGSVVVKVA